MSWELDFNNKTAIVTGAASGMGLLFSQNFTSLNGNVVMVDVNENVLNEKVDEINANGKGKAIGVVCDVRDYKQVVAVKDKAVEVFGTIDVMANFAGGTARRVLKHGWDDEFPDVPIEVFDWGLDVNLKGPFYFAHAVLSVMRRQNSGLIINIGSITGAEGDGVGVACGRSAGFGAGRRCACSRRAGSRPRSLAAATHKRERQGKGAGDGKDGEQFRLAIHVGPP